MTISIDGTEIGEIITIASVVGSIVSFLIVAIIIYFLVRPPRRQPQPRQEVEIADGEEMLAVMERMERRLEVLERAVRDQRTDRDRDLQAAEAPETRRTK